MNALQFVTNYRFHDRCLILRGLYMLSLVCCFFGTLQAKDSVKLSTQIDSHQIRIGDQFRYKIITQFDPLKFKVRFPVLSDTFNHLEIVEKLKPDTLQQRETQTITQEWILTGFDSGMWLIPKQFVEIQALQGGNTYTLSTDSFSVYVNTVSVDTAQPFKPIFGIRSAKRPWQSILFYILLGLGVLLVTGLLIWYLKKRRAKPKAQISLPEIILAPHERALQELETLQKEELWQQGFEKVYHTRLSDILRRYFEDQFSIDCFEKTSSEIMQQVKRQKALSTSRQQIRELLDRADMVKFAKSHPTAEEHEASLVQCREIIRESHKRIRVQTSSETIPGKQ